MLSSVQNKTDDKTELPEAKQVTTAEAASQPPSTKEAPAKLSKFEEYTQLSTERIKELMQNSAYINELNENDFVIFTSSSKPASQLAVESPYCMERFRSIRPSKHQTFFRSCAAWAILSILHDHNKLGESSYSSATELAIYREIWEQAGGIADLEKMLAYIARHALPISILEITDVVQTVLARAPALQEKYALFKRAAEKLPNQQIKSTEPVRSVFETGMYSLLPYLCHTHQGCLHILLATIDTSGHTTIQDPSTGLSHETTNLNDFKIHNRTFTGIAFNIPRPR